MRRLCDRFKKLICVMLVLALTAPSSALLGADCSTQSPRAGSAEATKDALALRSLFRAMGQELFSGHPFSTDRNEEAFKQDLLIISKRFSKDPRQQLYQMLHREMISSLIDAEYAHRTLTGQGSSEQFVTAILTKRHLFPGLVAKAEAFKQQVSPAPVDLDSHLAHLIQSAVVIKSLEKRVNQITKESKSGHDSTEELALALSLIEELLSANPLNAILGAQYSRPRDKFAARLGSGTNPGTRILDHLVAQFSTSVCSSLDAEKLRTLDFDLGGQCWQMLRKWMLPKAKAFSEKAVHELRTNIEMGFLLAPIHEPPPGASDDNRVDIDGYLKRFLLFERLPFQFLQQIENLSVSNTNVSVSVWRGWIDHTARRLEILPDPVRDQAFLAKIGSGMKDYVSSSAAGVAVGANAWHWASRLFSTAASGAGSLGVAGSVAYVLALPVAGVYASYGLMKDGFVVWREGLTRAKVGALFGLGFSSTYDMSAGITTSRGLLVNLSDPAFTAWFASLPIGGLESVLTSGPSAKAFLVNIGANMTLRGALPRLKGSYFSVLKWSRQGRQDFGNGLFAKLTEIRAWTDVLRIQKAVKQKWNDAISGLKEMAGAAVNLKTSPGRSLNLAKNSTKTLTDAELKTLLGTVRTGAELLVALPLFAGLTVYNNGIEALSGRDFLFSIANILMIDASVAFMSGSSHFWKTAFVLAAAAGGATLTTSAFECAIRNGACNLDLNRVGFEMLYVGGWSLARGNMAKKYFIDPNKAGVRTWAMHYQASGPKAITTNRAVASALNLIKRDVGGEFVLYLAYSVVNNIFVGIPGYTFAVDTIFNDPNLKEAMNLLLRNQVTETYEYLGIPDCSKPSVIADLPASVVGLTPAAAGPNKPSALGPPVTEPTSPSNVVLPQVSDVDPALHEENRVDQRMEEVRRLEILTVERQLALIITEKYFESPSKERRAFLEAAVDARVQQVCGESRIRKSTNKVCALLGQIGAVKKSWDEVVAEYKLRADDDGPLLREIKNELDGLAKWYHQIVGIRV